MATSTSKKTNSPSVLELLEQRRKQKAQAEFIPPSIPGLLPIPGESLASMQTSVMEAHRVSVLNEQLLAEANKPTALPEQRVSVHQAAANARNRGSNEFVQVFFGPVGANIEFKDKTTGKFGNDGYYVSQTIAQYMELKAMYGVTLATPEMLRA